MLRWQTFTIHIAPAIPETLSNKCAFLCLFVIYLVFVWCAQIIRLHKVESGTVCAEDMPQGAEHALLALPTCSFARLFDVKHHLCDNSKEIVLTYFCRVHLSLTNEGIQP